MMTIEFTPNDTGNPSGKPADAKLHFGEGPLDGLRLLGFAVWARRDDRRYVTFPTRRYSLNGERRSFAFSRPAVDGVPQDRLRELILANYREHHSQLVASA